MPRTVNVRVQVLLGRFATAYTVARIIVAENVAVDPGAEAQVETAHLAQVDGVAVGKQDGKPGVGAAAHEQTGDPIAAGRPREQTFDVFLFPLRVLPFGLLRQCNLTFRRGLIGETVRRLGRQEGQFGGDPRRERRAAEYAAKFAERKPVHSERGRRRIARPTT